MKTRLRFAVSLAVVALIGLWSTPSFAEARCLWLNAATAGGVLGGDVAMTVTPLTLVADQTCEFTHTSGTAVSMLRIEVHTMEPPDKDFAFFLSQCTGAKIPLKRIGNEAVQCLNKGNPTQPEEQIIGRVRDRMFTLTIRRNNGNAVAKDMLQDDTRNVAEQIAGSLF